MRRTIIAAALALAVPLADAGRRREMAGRERRVGQWRISII
jgi:hypothetical protein